MVPNHRVALEYSGWYAARNGEYEKAIALFERLHPAMGYRLHRSTCLGWVYFKMGKKETADDYLEEMETLKQQPGRGIMFAVDLAILYTCFGNYDKAFQNLEEALTHKIGDMMMLQGLDLFFDPLRSDPRYAKMVELIGLH
jgi:tetratricopeptide (TPR) repeat protein